MTISHVSPVRIHFQGLVMNELRLTSISSSLKTRVMSMIRLRANLGIKENPSALSPERLKCSDFFRAWISMVLRNILLGRGVHVQ